jgi:hypothetical protein
MWRRLPFRSHDNRFTCSLPFQAFLFRLRQLHDVGRSEAILGVTFADWGTGTIPKLTQPGAYSES